MLAFRWSATSIDPRPGAHSTHCRRNIESYPQEMMTLPPIRLSSLVMTRKVFSLHLPAVASLLVLAAGFAAGLLAAVFRF